MTRAIYLAKSQYVSPRLRLQYHMMSGVAYAVICIALVVMMIREGLSGLPYVSAVALLKIPAVAVAVILGLPTIFLKWSSLRMSQKRYLVTCLLLIIGGFISLVLNPLTGRLEYWLLLIELAAISAGIAVFIEDIKLAYVLLNGVLLIAVINCIWGLVNNLSFASTIDLASNIEVERFAGLKLDPNYFSMMIMLPLGYSFSMVASSRSSSLKRLLFGILAALFILCVLWSRSRAGGIGILLMGCSTFLLYGPQGVSRLISIVLIGTLLMITAVGWNSYSNIIGGYTSRILFSQDEGILSRAAIWNAAEANIEASPIWGTGPGSIEIMISMGIYQGMGGYIKPHNGWIVVAIERGLMGLGLQACLILIGLTSALGLRKSQAGQYIDLGNTILLGGIGQLIISMSLGGLPLGIFFTSALAAGVAIESSALPSPLTR